MPDVFGLPPLPRWYAEMYRDYLARLYDLVHDIGRPAELRIDVVHRQLTRG